MESLNLKSIDVIWNNLSVVFVQAPWLLMLEGDYVWMKPLQAPKAESSAPSWAYPCESLGVKDALMGKRKGGGGVTFDTVFSMAGKQDACAFSCGQRTF